ncbi:MFS transporter [Alicyclobacillus sp. ALC3]|uniref:MFS transporter n=1 Tax=Alicyclobacillus sp. ALC3 TaxID=2796143 RepID=UPI002379837C|nr:MFS transporter [Alicyclobacillus sp. ALC3]WDL96025.1 MFS transporter [Alicyclobacillus sp. ALC3]
MTHTSTRTTSWRVVLALFFITSAVESMSMSHVFAFMPVYLESMHVPHVETWVGILSAVTFLVGLPFVPLWGVWAGRYGGKLVVIRSAYVEMVVFIVLGLSHSLAGVFIAMMLVGFQLGNTGIMLAAIRKAAPDDRIGFAVAMFSVSSSLGMAGGPLFGGVITGFHLLGLHGLYLLDGGLSFLTGTMLFLLYRQPELGSVKSAAQQHPESAWATAWQSIRFTFSLPVTWTLFGIYTVLMMARQMITPYLPIAIEQLPMHFVSTTLSIGGLMGLSAVVGAVITVIAGRIGDRIGFHKILLFAFIVSLPAVLVLGFSHNVAWFSLALTLFSAGYSMGGAMVFALFSTRIPETHRSTAMNLVYLPLYIGGIIGPGIASSLTHIGLFAPFAAAGVLFVIAVVTVVATRKYTTVLPSATRGETAL